MIKLMLAALMVAFFTPVQAETFDNIVYDNADYSIVLSVKPCTVDSKHFPYGMVFEYEGTAFDNNGVTKTCWNKEGDFYNVWFHEEIMITIGSYREYLFKPVKPEL
jgi:hypothetical protein